MISYDLDFLDLKEFCLDFKILHEYIFIEIEYKIWSKLPHEQIGYKVTFDIFIPLAWLNSITNN
jgi:hypothetical protein